jgi:uncharacterized protein (DUF697 family)
LPTLGQPRRLSPMINFPFLSVFAPLPKAIAVSSYYSSSFSVETIQNTLQTITQSVQTVIATVDDITAPTGNAVFSSVQPLLEPLAETIGKVVAPVAHIPFIERATLIPGVKWLLAAVGQVNAQAVRQQVDELRRQYPLDTKRELARRVMADTAVRAAGIGLVTNFIPPAAIALSLVDLGAVAALQADMIYRIAAIYGYSPEEDTRRGEVLGLWMLSSGGSSVLKSGLNVIETLPAVGGMLGVAADAGLIYSVGYLACRYYETKRELPTEIPVQAT